METKWIKDPQQRMAIAREVLTDLPEWFGIPESVEAYVKESASQPFVAVHEGGVPIGFMTMKETSAFTAELAVCGVKKRFHRSGAGSAMFTELRADASRRGYEYLQVKTVAGGLYPEYDATRMFYETMGFRPLEIFPTLWDEQNPCLVMIMRL